MSSCLKLNLFCNKWFNTVPEDVELFLNNYGNLNIVKLVAKRIPLPSIYENILTVLTFNQWKQKKEEYKIKNFFHTYLVATFENGTQCIIEKYEVVSISSDITPDDEYTESMDVNLVRSISLHDLIQNTLNKVGDYKFYVYDDTKQNCQVLTCDILQSNGILTNDLKKFILQDVDELFNKLGENINELIDTTTTLGSVYKRFLQKIKN